MKNKQYAEAIVAFTHAIELRPACARYYFARGNCFLKLEEYQRCLFDYSLAIRIDPQNPVYYGLCGVPFPLRPVALLPPPLLSR